MLSGFLIVYTAGFLQLLTCLGELSHLTGTVVRDSWDRVEWCFPVSAAPKAHMTDEGGQQRVGRTPKRQFMEK